MLANKQRFIELLESINGLIDLTESEILTMRTNPEFCYEVLQENFGSNKAEKVTEYLFEALNLSTAKQYTKYGGDMDKKYPQYFPPSREIDYDINTDNGKKNINKKITTDRVYYPIENDELKNAKNLYFKLKSMEDPEIKKHMDNINKTQFLHSYMTNKPIKQKIPHETKTYKKKNHETGQIEEHEINLNDQIKETTIDNILSKLKGDNKFKQIFDHDRIKLSEVPKDKLFKTQKLVLSRHPYDIAGQATGRKWKSCQNLGDECVPEKFRNDSKNEKGKVDVIHGPAESVEHDAKHSLVGYRIYSDDENINDPISRIAIKPHKNSKDETILLPDATAYRSAGIRKDFGLYKKLTDIINSKQNIDELEFKKFPKIYYNRMSLLPFVVDDIINKSNLSEEETKKRLLLLNKYADRNTLIHMDNSDILDLINSEKFYKKILNL